jgi:cytochrome c oxidase subunit II
MRRLALVPLVLALAGCGYEGVAHPLPQKVVGTVKLAAPGKAIFTAQGCNSCHTYAPAAAKGTVGPDLDKLAQYAKQAKQPLDAFTKQSIVDPNAYVQPGYPKGVMPQTYKTSLSAEQLSQLVDFLTKPQG